MTCIVVLRVKVGITKINFGINLIVLL